MDLFPKNLRHCAVDRNFFNHKFTNCKNIVNIIYVGIKEENKMTISIRVAYNNIMSKKYNKKNVLIYMALAILAWISSAFCTKNTTPGIMAAAILIYTLLFIIGVGIIPLAIHNNFKEKENVFPSVISDIKDILLIALKNIAGALIASIFIVCVLGLISVLSLKLNNIVGIIIIIALSIIYLLLLISLYAQFTSKLNFKAWFNFKNALNLIKNNCKSFGIYILKYIFIFVLAFIPFMILIVIASVILTLLLQGNNEALNNITTRIIGGIIGGVIGTYIDLYCIDITGQFLKEIMPKTE